MSRNDSFLLVIFSVSAIVFGAASNAAERASGSGVTKVRQAKPAVPQRRVQQAAPSAVKAEKSAGACQLKPQADESADLVSPRLVLKHGRYFLVTDQAGMIPGGASSGYGLYADDTRFVSRWEIKLDGNKPVLLDSDVDDGFGGHFLYANKGSEAIPEQSLMLQRDIIAGNGLRERWLIRNFNDRPVTAKVQLVFDADFKDMFEVRGWQRRNRGTAFAPEAGRNSVAFAYTGTDGIKMTSAVHFRNAPALLQPNCAEFLVDIAARGSQALDFAVLVESAEQLPLAKLDWFAEQSKSAELAFEKWMNGVAIVTSDDANLNHVLKRIYRDLYILQQPTPRGKAIAAGIPWYSVAFGRDQCITALQMLPFAPDLARDVIRTLAAYQGMRKNEFTEEHPGKIMHELRTGEMARSREIPFIPYYGTVDATPLWLMLLDRYVDWTGDQNLAGTLWPSISLSLNYLLEHSTLDGYLSYGGTGALTNQAWKDSGDSVSYSDGNLAKPPLRLCEVQGYLYGAWRGAARLADRLGYGSVALDLRTRAERLKANFNRDFWMDNRRFYAMALDGDGRQCDVVSSNPGHLLFTGIVDDERAKAISDRLFESDMFSDWGIRTLSSRERRYNPMSYHNGSVWPHDNALFCSGLPSIAEAKRARRILSRLLSVAQRQGDKRLPELFCGFSPSEFPEPVPYPVSCSPQAWAAGAIPQILLACLDLQADAGGKLKIGPSAVAPVAGVLKIRGLHFRGARYDIETVDTAEAQKLEIRQVLNGANVSIKTDED